MPLILPIRLDSAIGANHLDSANPGRCGARVAGKIGISAILRLVGLSLLSYTVR